LAADGTGAGGVDARGPDAGDVSARGCGKCPVCINIEKGYHQDTLEMPDNGETVKIEPMREILAKLATTSAGNYKVLLVENIERMTPETANALLKTLEEPPSQVIFLLTTAHVEDILQTVLSRVRLLKFRTLPDEKIAALLHQKFPFESEEKIQALVNFAFGLPGRALFFAGNEKLLAQAQALFEQVRDVLRRNDTVEKFALVSSVVDNEELFADFFDIFLLALRYRMMDEMTELGEMTKSECQMTNEAAGPAASPEKLQRTVNVILQTLEALRLQKRNVNARLLFENLMLQV
jgi:DNA polymerase-3 subunit delta'